MPRARKNPEDASLYQTMLALLRVIQWNAWTLHWQVSGPSAYGDHLLLQRLYEGEGEDGGSPDINGSIDALGERMVAYFGPDVVDPQKILEFESTIFKKVEKEVGFSRLLKLEKMLQKNIRNAFNENIQNSPSLGIDDYLAGLANDRDTAIYLIQQRIGGWQNREKAAANPRHRLL